MFLRWCSLTVLLFCAGAGAEDQVPGLQKQPYALKSLTKTFHGEVTSPSERTNFCGEGIIRPVLKKQNDQLILELNAGLGFEWRNVEGSPSEISEGCRYTDTQKIETAGESSSTLVLVNAEECESGKEAVGSFRSTLQLKGEQIEYRSESVVKDRAGAWKVVPSKEAFTCTWQAMGHEKSKK